MPVPKATENTITTHLKAELEELGLKAEAFLSISTPAGRREVDLYVENAGIYLCEAKFTERELIKALEKIQNDYMKYRKFLGINGCFSILYPEELSEPMPLEVLKELISRLNFKLIEVFPPEDTRKSFHVVKGTLSEIARELAKQVLTPPEYVEPSVEWILRALRDSAEYITIGLRHLMGEQLEDLFGGEHVFRNILLYEKGEYPVEDLRIATAYLLVTQLLFYHVLSQRRRGQLPELPDQINRPEDLRYYFEKALKLNYRAIFAYDVVSRIPRKYTNQINTIISVIKALSPEKVGGDLLGTIFHDLVPGEVRKSVAAFYTNVLAAELLAFLAIDSPDAKVADFAVGSGGLLVAAYRRKRQLLKERKGSFTQEDHTKFVEEDLLGVDVMPFAASIAACNLALQAPEFLTNKVNIAVWDSTELTPGTTIPSVAGIKYVLRGQTQLKMFMEESEMIKGVVTLREEEEPDRITLGHYDVIIMNPPFTRQERVRSIPEEYKQVLMDRFSDYKEYLHGQMGYYGYFILLADRFLKEGGRLALVLPAAFLRLRSTQGLRTFLLKHYDIEYIIYSNLNFSEATWRREILFVARKRKDVISDPGKRHALFVRLMELPRSFEEARSMAEQIRSGVSSDRIMLRSVSYEELAECENLDWFKFIIGGISEVWESIKERAKNLIRFGELISSLGARIREGIESRKGMKIHAVLILSDESRARRKKDRWIAEKVRKEDLIVRDRYMKLKALKIPLHAVIPWIRTVADNAFMDLTNEKLDYLVVQRFADIEEFLEDEELIKVLPRWKDYVKDRLGNLIVLRRFVIPAPGTIHLSYYSETPIGAPGMAWIINIDDEVAKILCLWFNSSLNLAQALSLRVEDAWIDIHKYILERFMVPDVTQLSSEEKRLLISTFNKVRKMVFPSLFDQYMMEKNPKEEIDRAFLKILGFDENEINDILRELYAALREELSRLRDIYEKSGRK